MSWHSSKFRGAHCLIAPAVCLQDASTEASPAAPSTSPSTARLAGQPSALVNGAAQAGAPPGAAAAAVPQAPRAQPPHLAAQLNTRPAGAPPPLSSPPRPGASLAPPAGPPPSLAGTASMNLPRTAARAAAIHRRGAGAPAPPQHVRAASVRGAAAGGRCVHRCGGGGGAAASGAPSAASGAPSAAPCYAARRAAACSAPSAYVRRARSHTSRGVRLWTLRRRRAVVRRGAVWSGRCERSCGTGRGGCRVQPGDDRRRGAAGRDLVRAQGRVQEEEEAEEGQLRMAGGEKWVDDKMELRPENDFRIFVGNLGPEVRLFMSLTPTAAFNLFRVSRRSWFMTGQGEALRSPENVRCIVAGASKTIIICACTRTSVHVSIKERCVRYTTFEMSDIVTQKCSRSDAKAMQVNEDVLAKAFQPFPSYAKCRIIQRLQKVQDQGVRLCQLLGPCRRRESVAADARQVYWQPALPAEEEHAHGARGSRRSSKAQGHDSKPAGARHGQAHAMTAGYLAPACLCA